MSFTTTAGIVSFFTIGTVSFLSAGTARAHASTNPDLGWTGGYDDGTYGHAGFFRDASDGIFKVYDGYTLEPDETPYIDTNHSSFNLADLQAGNFIGNGAQITNVNAASVGGSTIEEIEGNALALAIALG